MNSIAITFNVIYESFIYSLKVVPKQDLQQQQANEHTVLPAQQTASVAIVKHIFSD